MKYQETHPWIRFSRTFPLDANFCPLWYLLGQSRSKIEHLTQSPASPQVHQQLNQVYLAKGVQATTAIEGNTLSEEEIHQIMDNGKPLAKSKQYQEQEVKNILAACNKLVDDALYHQSLTFEYICTLNKLVLRELAVEDGVVPGAIRNYSVTVGQYRGAPAEDCEYLVQRLCSWLESEVFSAPADMKLSMAILKAIIAHIYLAWIHPFGDGNGRTARLVELFILLKAGVPVPAAHLLSNHYNKTRNEYYRHLAALSIVKDGHLPNLDSFIEYALQGLTDGLQEQIDRLQMFQKEVVWKQYVHDVFKGVSPRAIATRREDLLLSLPATAAPLTVNTLSPKVFNDHYKGKTARTLNRDVAELVQMGLLKKEGGSLYRPCTERVLEMMPIHA